MMYKPMRFFTIVAAIPFLIGLALGIRFLIYFCLGAGSGHVQSLILSSTLMMLGFMTFIIGLQADIIAANRKLLEDVRYKVSKMYYGQSEEEKEDRE